MNFGKLIKGQNYNIPVKLVDKYNNPLVLDGPVSFEFRTPEQTIDYTDDDTYNPNNYTLNTNDSISLDSLLISDGLCYQNPNDPTVWIANITVPDDCKESQENYEFYSLTFFCNYRKTEESTDIIAKEVQKLFTVYEPQLSVLNENMPYIFYRDSHIIGNILLPQPYEIDEVQIDIVEARTGNLIYTTKLKHPKIYKQNNRFNIYTFITAQQINVLLKNFGNPERLQLQYSYTLKSLFPQVSVPGKYDSLGTVTDRDETKATKDEIQFVKQTYHLNNPIFIMSERIIQLITDVKFEIEKAGIFNYDKYLVWRDHDIFEALLLGLSRLNGTYPPTVTYHDLSKTPAQMQYALRCAALYELYKAWFLAESFKKFDFQGMDISLSVDRTDALTALMTKADDWINANVSEIKKRLTSLTGMSRFTGTICYNTPFYPEISLTNAQLLAVDSGLNLI